jgi:hypothetical protein
MAMRTGFQTMSLVAARVNHEFKVFNLVVWRPIEHGGRDRDQV